MDRSQSRSRSPKRKLKYQDVVNARKKSRWEDDNDDAGQKGDKYSSRSDDRSRRKDSDRRRDRHDDDDDYKRRRRNSDADKRDPDDDYQRNKEQQEENQRRRAESLRKQDEQRQQRGGGGRRDRGRDRRGSDNRDRRREEKPGGKWDRDNDDRDRRRRRSRDRRRSRSRSLRADEDDKDKTDGDEGPPVEKEKPTLERTHRLVAETNTVNGTVLKYVEPVDSRLPPVRDKWKLYTFKGSETLGDLHLSGRTCWLVGRDRSVADIPTDHPSCSGQHAAFQFRFVTTVDEWGEKKGSVKPYIMDLKSANGTFVNKVQIPAERFYELRAKDLVTFGLSTREYVLMLEK